MTRPSIPVTRVHHVDDMLGIIPHLLGFHPSESVVLVAVVDGIVELTARADLEDLLPAGHVELLIGRVLARFPQSLVWIVGYASDESSCTEVLIRGRDHLQGNLAFEPICVSGGRYRVGDWAEWFPYDPAATTSAAEATVHGLQARRSRSELSRGLRADPRHRSQVEDAYADACLRYQRVSSEDRPAALLAAIHAGLHDPEALDPRELAWLGALINDPYARDAAVLSLETFAASAWVRLWSRVVQSCPHGTQQQPLAILALAAWVSGDGGLQSVCLEELDALGLEPGLKPLLENINAAVLPPSEWPVLRERLRMLLEEDADEVAGGPGESGADQVGDEVG
ncbi:MAG: DUF4192 domain-containing protein [Micropruina sp.]|nr:DUF4192 domain-containing protein [Micropruina sp.]